MACVHHWQIERPAGETSRGVCKLCGAIRLFTNSTPHRTPSRGQNMPGASGQSKPSDSAAGLRRAWASRAWIRGTWNRN